MIIDPSRSSPTKEIAAVPDIPTSESSPSSASQGDTVQHNSPNLPQPYDPKDDETTIASPLNTLDLREKSNSPTATPTELRGPEEFDMTVTQERIYLAVLCFCLFMAGWNDATLGPLLPRIQEVYHVNYTVVSMLFVSSCVGFITGAASNVYLSDKLGFGKVITAAAALQVGTYAVMAAGVPFPVFCVAYFVNGIGLAIQDAQSNAFIASIPRNPSRNMGVLHCIYGITHLMLLQYRRALNIVLGLGAFVCPLVATQFAQQRRWSFHFFTSMSIALLNTALLSTTFRLKRQNYFIPDSVHGDQGTTASSENKYKEIFLNRSVQLMAFYILVYVGVEVTIGGWSFTYLLNERGGGPSAGYVSSGFFAGLTLGRVILLPVNAIFGYERVIYLYCILCLALEFTVWFVPHLVGNAIAISFMGLLLGPFYPIAMNVTTDLLPQRLLAGSIGWIAGFGQAGAALFPFITGALASHFGVKVLQPLLVAMIAFQTLLWVVVTHSGSRRKDSA